MTPVLYSTQTRRGTGRVLLIALFALLGFWGTETRASAQSWSLTNTQRKAYLYYYAPIIMKRANESSTKPDSTGAPTSTSIGTGTSRTTG